MSLDQVNQRLLSYVPHQTKLPYTLERMRRLMNRLGNPQDNLRIIHIAGTSGKTSTAYYTASFLKEAGFKVGLTVSPHIAKVSERAQINLQVLNDDEFSFSLNQFLDLIDAFAIYPTYFEVLIAFAYWFFNKQCVDFAVIEVGVGGLFDGTNVINQIDKSCIITDIGFDHTEILGKTIEEISMQKAGIIQKGNQVWINHQSETIESVIADRCTFVGAHLTVLNGTNDHTLKNQFNSIPSFQHRNSALAYRAVCARIGHQLEPEQIIRAMEIIIPGRMEIFHYDNRTVILDGSHNEQKITALVGAIKASGIDLQIALIVSFGQNKSASVDQNLNLLSTISNSVIFTKFDLGQDVLRTAIDPGKLSVCAERYFEDISIECSPEKAFRQALKGKRSVVLIVGSFYLLNHIRPLLIADVERKH